LKILFVRPPRYMWPMNSESSSFWQPLGFASMAAVLRENDFDVSILDCLPLKMGWKSLAKELEKRKPDVLCVGDETASYCEASRLVRLAKDIDKDTVCVAGGYHFGNAIQESFEETPVDYIVRGEGEITLLELVKALHTKTKLSGVKGIAFKNSKRVRINHERPLMANLDSLPFPAYDLLPMELYGKQSRNHKDFVAQEHGRGCVGGCNFCSIWAQMSNKGEPCYRTKSAQRSFEETELLVKKYKRKTINWVDGTFNLNARWNGDYFQLLESNNLHVNHTTWIRSNCVVRDERLGILKKMVDNGLVQAVIGMERFDDKSMKLLGKRDNSPEINNQAFKILREKYPSVYTIATLIYGMPDDTWRDLLQINRIIHSNYADMIFMLPYTPYPGTSLWRKYRQSLRNADLRKFNLHLPVMGTNTISKGMLDLWFKLSLIDYVLFRPGNLMRRIVKEPHQRKKRVQKSLAKKILRLGTQHLLNRLTLQECNELEYGIKPGWYDS
jgi:anaerobic magnesium-protoporphyrin IX monomethyl ester cyclase